MMKLSILLVYRPFYAVLKKIVLLIQGSLDKKYRAWIHLREQTTIFPQLNETVIWLHASSGEIEYLKSFIREHKKLKPTVSIVVSYSSPSAVKLFENVKLHVDYFFPLPWDQPAQLNKIIETLNPSSFYFGRTDLWPELIFQLSLRKIKIYVISYNPSLGLFNRLWSKIFLSSFTGIFCTHPMQQKVLETIVPNSVVVLAPGDTRFDQVFWRLKQVTKIPFQFSQPYLVFGSTWIADEAIFVPLLKDLKALGYQIVWSPHEVDLDTMQRIETSLRDLNLTFVKLSDLTSTNADILLVDKVGYLADFYRLADGAFVGGSFKAKVHSVMEPLCCAIPVITGPHIANSPEGLQYQHVIMNEVPVVQVVQSSSEFLDAVKKIKALQKNDFKKLLIGHLEKNRYATQKITEFLFG